MPAYRIVRVIGVSPPQRLIRDAENRVAASHEVSEAAANQMTHPQTFLLTDPAALVSSVILCCRPIELVLVEWEAEATLDGAQWPEHPELPSELAQVMQRLILAVPLTPGALWSSLWSPNPTAANI